MPIILGGHVGPSRFGDNADGYVRIGNSGELIISDMNGKFAEQTMRGNAFVYRTTTAASITALGDNIPSLWNPYGSGKAIILNKLTLQVGAVGTPIATGIQYGFLPAAGANIGTLAPVATFTHVAPVSLAIGSDAASIARWAPAVCTFSVAPALLAPAGLDLGSTATETPYGMVDDINGRIVILPGGLIQVAASTATSKTFNVALWGIEVPLPLLA
jgi:hypothetical protein